MASSAMKQVLVQEILVGTPGMMYGFLSHEASAHGGGSLWNIRYAVWLHPQ